MALIFFGTIKDEGTPQLNSIMAFRLMCYIGLALGSVLAIFYMTQMQEKTLEKESKYFDEIYKKALYGDR